MNRKTTDAKSESFLTFNDHGEQEQDIYLVISQAVVSIILMMALMMCVQVFLGLGDMSVYIYVPGMILIGFLFIPRSRLRLVAVGGFFVLALVVFMMFHSYALNGVFVWLNHLFEVIGKQTGIIIAPYEYTISPEVLSLAGSVVAMYIGLVVASISFLIVKKRYALLLWVLLFILFGLQTIVTTDNMLIVNVMAIGAGLYVLMLSIYRKKSITVASSRGVFRFVSLFLVMVPLISGMVLFLFYPPHDDEQDDTENSVQAGTRQLVNDFRYEKNPTHTFTEGNFKDLSALELDDEPALEIVMEEPISVYLRGFVGSVYTSDRWKDLDPEVYYDHHDLFYWLYQQGFQPLNQLGLVNNFMADDDQLNQTTMKVHNVGASSQYLYAPYGLVTDIQEMGGVRTAFHDTVQSRKLFGERVYQFDLTENAIVNYPQLANATYAADNDEAVTYKEDERHYNAFVYDTYTNVPEKAMLMLEHHLDKEESTEGHMAYEKAIDRVRSFLAEHIQYQVDPAPLPDHADFLMHVLEDSKEGYATHYATAATLMFRYLGIPARYVEGYIVTPDAVEDKEEFEKIVVKGTDAHAWTEVYVDQLGWIPVETTPPYYHMMADIDTSHYPEGEDDTRSGNQTDTPDEPSGSSEIEDEPEKEVITPKTEENDINWTSYVIGASFIVLALLIVAVIIWFIIKRLSVKKRKQSFRDSDVDHAVAKIFSYGLFILQYDGITMRGGSYYDYVDDVRQRYGDEYANFLKQAILMNQKAVYSKQTLTEQDRQYMLTFMDETVTHVRQSKGFWKRLKMTHWDFVY